LNHREGASPAPRRIVIAQPILELIDQSLDVITFRHAPAIAHHFVEQADQGADQIFGFGHHSHRKSGGVHSNAAGMIVIIGVSKSSR
jgi:hypothetical protein